MQLRILRQRHQPCLQTTQLRTASHASATCINKRRCCPRPRRRSCAYDAPTPRCALLDRAHRIPQPGAIPSPRSAAHTNTGKTVGQKRAKCDRVGCHTCGHTSALSHAGGGAVQALKQYTTDMVVLIDVEHAYDKAYGNKLGLKSSRFYYSQPNSGDEALGVRLPTLHPLPRLPPRLWGPPPRLPGPALGVTATILTPFGHILDTFWAAPDRPAQRGGGGAAVLCVLLL